MNAGAGCCPGDVTVRQALQRELVAARYAAALTQRALAERLAVCQSRVHYIETGTNWDLATLQSYVRGCGRRLSIEVQGLPDVSGDGDAYAAVLAAMRPADPRAVDEHARLVTHNDLIRARRATGLTIADVSRRMGRSDTAVGAWERDGSNPQLDSLQRYARALGGALTAAVAPP